MPTVFNSAEIAVIRSLMTTKTDVEIASTLKRDAQDVHDFIHSITGMPGRGKPINYELVASRQPATKFTSAEYFTP